jgi:hypothetical protein
MAEVRLSDIRRGFAWSATISFPPGFLAVGESVRMKLRRSVDDTSPVACTSNRVGDDVTLSLAAGVTAGMERASYTGEAVIYKPLEPGFSQIPLTNNRYIVDCDDSPSE